MLPPGSFRVAPAPGLGAAISSSSSSSSSTPRLANGNSNNCGNVSNLSIPARLAEGNPNKTPPPIYMRLSEAALGQLRAAYSAPPPGKQAALQLDLLESGRGLTPSALVVGESSYALNKLEGTSTASTTDILSLKSVPGNSASKQARYPGEATSPSASATSALTGLLYLLATSTPHHVYQSANIPTAKRSVPREKTAANMNERLRERNAELEKQKEARRVVVVDDESMLSVAGKNGKGKGKKAASVTSSPLLKPTSATNTKRTASPAGRSPLLGAAATRAPSRLIASEAAKGLMGKKEKEVSEQTARIHAEQLLRQRAQAAHVATVKAEEEAKAKAAALAEAARMASSTSSTSSHSSFSNSTNLSTSTNATTVSSVSNPPIARPMQQRRYYEPKRDVDDLASASESDDDTDAAPLAQRVASPVKTAFEPPTIPLQQTQPGPVVSKPAPSKPPTKAAAKKTSAVKTTKTKGTKAKASISPIGEPTPPLPPVSVAPIAPKPASPPVVQRLRESSEESASSSSSRSPSPPKRKAPTTIVHGSPPSTKRQKTEADAPIAVVQPTIPATATAAAPLPSPVIVKPSVASKGGPKTAAKTAGGSRLSKAIPKRSPAPSHTASPVIQPVTTLPAIQPVSTLSASVTQSQLQTAASHTSAPVVSLTPPLDEVLSDASGSSPAASASSPEVESVNHGEPVGVPEPVTPIVAVIPTDTTPPAEKPEVTLAVPVKAPSPSVSSGLHPLPSKPSTAPSAPPSRGVSPSSSSTSSQTRQSGSHAAPQNRPKMVLPASLPARPSEDTVAYALQSGHGKSRNAPPRSRESSQPLPPRTASPASMHFNTRRPDHLPSSRSSSTAPVARMSARDVKDDRKRKASDDDERSSGVENGTKKAKTASSMAAKEKGKVGTKKKREMLVFTSSEGEDEDAEGAESDFETVDPSTAAPTEYEEGEFEDGEISFRGRSTARKAVASSAQPATSHVRALMRTDVQDPVIEEEKPAKLDKDGLPSFKKGRTAQLAAANGKVRDSSAKGTPNASRAQTPVSAYTNGNSKRDESSSSRRDDSPYSISVSTYKIYAALREVTIRSDTDFEYYSGRYIDELHPTYDELFAKIEKVGKALASSHKPTVSPTDLKRMVDECNARSSELSMVRRALERYNAEKERKASAVSRH